MSIAAHIPTPKLVLVELEILLTIIAIGGWGGFVSYLMKCEKSQTHKHIMDCLAQIAISCFTAFLLSVAAIDRNMSFNMVLMLAGLGGVFATPILRILSERVKSFLGGTSLLK
ncbi:phage holin family protein [Cronobacter muytjensii]|nr:phage holin family protein [Cronobacter muytjensii]